jgi:hypothetical protein
MDFPIVNLVLALWTLIDGYSRKIGMHAPAWALGSLLLGPFVFPFYDARKPLRERETRANGNEWQVLKGLVFCWTLVLVEVVIRILIGPGREEKQMAWSAVMGFALVMSGGLWLAFSIGALIVGFRFNKTENGRISCVS